MLVVVARNVLFILLAIFLSGFIVDVSKVKVRRVDAIVDVRIARLVGVGHVQRTSAPTDMIGAPGSDYFLGSFFAPSSIFLMYFFGSLLKSLRHDLQ